MEIFTIIRHTENLQKKKVFRPVEQSVFYESFLNQSMLS
jgi:hypothetical protein